MFKILEGKNLLIEEHISRNKNLVCGEIKEFVSFPPIRIA